MAKRFASSDTIDLTESDTVGQDPTAVGRPEKRRRREPEPELSCVVRTNVRMTKDAVNLFQIVSVSANVGSDGSITSRVTGIPRGYATGKFLSSCRVFS